MNPIVLALFNALINIYNQVMLNQLLLKIIIGLLVAKPLFQLIHYLYRNGWFKRSEFDRRK